MLGGVPVNGALVTVPALVRAGQRAGQLPCLISGRCPHRRAADRFTLGCHGKQIGTRVAGNIPDSLELANEQDMTVPCYQEEIRVRNITFPQIGLTSSM